MSEHTEIWRSGLEQLIEFKRSQRRMTGWFVAQENKMNVREEMRAAGKDPDAAENQAELLCECVRRLPLSIPRGSVIAGTQDDAFSPSYALINPAFQVETFAGYCDPVAVYDDLAPDDEFPAERIAKVRKYFSGTPYVKALNEVYRKGGEAIHEVVYFVEPVTGHVIPDFRAIMKSGVAALPAAGGYGKTIRDSAQAAVILANRYADLAEKLMRERSDDPAEVERLRLIAANCRRVPEHGAENFQQAVQSYALSWQVMCLEQAPNPYAFSLGNIDRMFAPYAEGCEFADQVVLIRSLLAFLMVGRRCWAISQNVLLGGRDLAGNDMTNETTYAILQAFFESNYPQPALSVRLHRNTPREFYAALEKFYFTPGHSTPSIFNDDAMFNVLRRKGIADADIENYAIAGCQEPLIVGYENGNTTNSWLNLPKVLELALNDGRSLLTGEKLGPDWKELGYADADAAYADLENAFFKMLDRQLPRMAESANGCTKALKLAPAPFSSLALNCLDSGRDLRDAENPGTKYNGSGCLIHGLSVLADSIFAVRKALEAGVADAAAIREALQTDFAGAEKLRQYLLHVDKFGNQLPGIDALTVSLADRVAAKVYALRNAGGYHFMPDYSTPSTHLLYGYWVGATPDGRKARTMLNYGVDSLPGNATHGLPSRMISNAKLPFVEFAGGYASHIGLDPAQFSGDGRPGEKMKRMYDRVIAPLFGFAGNADSGKSAFYAYFNVDSAGELRKVLAEPGKYAPDGIYIIRIHGTFVNFLDLSPAIQQDIIQRLDPGATSIEATA